MTDCESVAKGDGLFVCEGGWLVEAVHHFLLPPPLFTSGVGFCSLRIAKRGEDINGIII